MTDPGSYQDLLSIMLTNICLREQILPVTSPHALMTHKHTHKHIHVRRWPNVLDALTKFVASISNGADSRERPEQSDLFRAFAEELLKAVQVYYTHSYII
jgi:hypothetical protein